MGSLRKRRIEELLREEISKLIIEELADPRIGFATVTAVKLDDDLKNANVSVSFLLSESKRSAAIVALNSSAGYIRHKLLPYLKMRKAPDIHFELDEGLARSAHISDLIREARKSDPEPGALDPHSEDSAARAGNARLRAEDAEDAREETVPNE